MAHTPSSFPAKPHTSFYVHPAAGGASYQGVLLAGASMGIVQDVAQEEASGTQGRRRGLTLPTLWAIVAVFLPVVAALESSLSTIDLAYQIRAGDLMLRTHHLLRTDTFTFPAFGRPWLDQQWGAQVLFAWVYRLGGWAGLALLRATLVGTIFLFVFLACRTAGTALRRSAWLALASFGVTVGGLSLRPQLIGMVLFPLTVWLVFDRHRHPGRLWLIPAIVALWANVHGSFFLAPVLLGLAWLEDLRDRAPRPGRTFWVGVASVAAATLNPFGLKVWAYALGITTNPEITRFVTEWQPPTIRDFAGASFFISVAAVVVILAVRGRRTDWPSLLSLGLFFAIGLFAVRGIFWWAMVAPPIVAKLLAQDAMARGRSPEAVLEDERVRSRPAVLNLAFVAALSILAFTFLPWFRPVTPPSGKGLLSDAPAALTDALRRVVPPGSNVFVAQKWGSWVEFAVPEDLVAVDSRIEVTPASEWGKYTRVSVAQQGWQQVLDQWGVQAVLASREQQNQLLPWITRDPGWRLVLRDRQGALFARR